MTEIEIRDLKKTFHVGDVDVHALRGVNLRVEGGEFIAIVGPSGSGKSTLFNILGGLTPPTSGTVTIDGKDLTSITDSETNADAQDDGGVRVSEIQPFADVDRAGQHRNRAVTSQAGTARSGMRSSMSF